MKRFLMLFLVIGLVSGCSEKQEEQSSETEIEQVKVEVPKIDYADQLFTFDLGSLPDTCEKNSQIVCAIDLVAKCAVDPKRPDCDKTKVPSYLFIEDPEHTMRPTHFEYKITKIKPIDVFTAEVFTESRCNGSLFGLCDGNVIFVVKLEDGDWNVKDLYAIQRPGEVINTKSMDAASNVVTE